MRRTAIDSSTTSWPPTRKEPLSGASKVATMRINVVLPAPFGPRMATGSPGGRVRLELREGLDLSEALREAVGLYQGVHARAFFPSS